MTALALNDGGGRRVGRLTLAFGIAVAAHVGLAWWLARPLPDPATAQSAGVGGITIDLGPAGGASGATPQPPETVPETMPMTPPEPQPETTEAPPVEPPTLPAAAPLPEPLPVPDPVTEALPVETTDPKPEPKDPPPEPVTPPPKPVPTAPAPAVKPPPPPRPAPSEPVQPRRPAAAATPAPSTAPPAPSPAPAVPGAPTASGVGDAVNQGTSTARSGGGDPGARQDYLSSLQAWLERHKTYPRAAKLRRQEGTVLLRFSIDRQGRVLNHAIVRSSGHDALDEQVETLIRRASPMPAMPPTVPGDTLQVTVPIVFALR